MEKEITLKVKYRVLGEVTFPLTDTNPDYAPHGLDMDVEEEGIYVIEGGSGKLRLARLPVSVVGY